MARGLRLRARAKALGESRGLPKPQNISIVEIFAVENVNYTFGNTNNSRYHASSQALLKMIAAAVTTQNHHFLYTGTTAFSTGTSFSAVGLFSSNPHSRQNAALISICSPQLGQYCTSDFPHWLQKTSSSFTGDPQNGHVFMVHHLFTVG